MTLYTRLRRSTEDMGASQAQVTRATEIITKAFAISGATASEAKNGVIQLGQALGSGTLRGQDLRSVLEEAPVLAKMIAKGMGVSVMELRHLGEQGKLTADKVFKAILDGGKDVDAAFAKTKPTIANSFEVLHTAMTRYVGEANEAGGASALFSGAIIKMADHIETAAPLAFSLAAGLSAAFVGGPVVGGITAATVALVAFSNQIHPISGELASLADYASVAWDMIKDGGGKAATFVQEKFHEAAQLIAQAMSGDATGGFQVFLKAVKIVTNTIIGTFVFTADAIKESFAKLGPALGDIMMQSVNGIVASVEWMINKVIAGINAITAFTNQYTGSSFRLENVDLGRFKNGFAGAGAEAGHAYGDAFNKAFGKDYVGGALAATEQGLRRMREKANELGRERQKAAPKKADDGSLDNPLKPGRDLEGEKKAEKQAKSYASMIAKAREFIQTQEVERQALTLNAEKAEALRKEQQLLNEATNADIKLTPAQRKEIENLAEGMTKAEFATKRFADMKQSIEQLSETIGTELGDALGNVITKSGKLEDTARRLAILFFKLAMQAALLGKGPLAGLFGIKEGGLLGNLDIGNANAARAALKQIVKPEVKASDMSSYPAASRAVDAERAAKAAATAAAGSTTDRVGGSRSWRNNNPGNIEYGPFAKSMGATGSDGRFAIFPDYGAGRAAQEKLLFDSKGYRDLTLGKAISRWAPASENNVPAYLRAMGGDPNTRMRDFTKDQRQALLDAMQKHEGWKVGKTVAKDTGVQQAMEAQRRLAEQQKEVAQAATQSVTPLNQMQDGVAKMAGSLSQGVPEVGSFTSSIEKLIAKLFTGGGGASFASVLGFAEGGHVAGPGTGVSDSIPAMLSAGEFVVNAKAVSRHRGLLEAVNSGRRLPAFAGGGFVGMSSYAPSSVYSPSVNVHVAGGARDAGFAKQIADHVGVALAAQGKPDGFRRNRGQQLAELHRAGALAFARNG
ncbi:MAG: tape measure protein [Rhodoblastus sp.]|nr:tape measure protein [Rhodoblastus sp.]MCC0001521.1 tape measure protein [Methylobacteriaceae bacterium]